MLSFEQVSEVQNLNLISLEMFSLKIVQSTFYVAFPMSRSVPKLGKWPIVFENYVFLEWAGFLIYSLENTQYLFLSYAFLLFRAKM